MSGGSGLGPHSLADRAAELRQSFDRSFALEPAAHATAWEDLLALGVGPAHFAVRLAEVAGLTACREVTALPEAPPELLGLAGLRGALVPVYDLAALLGLVATAPRWLALATGGKVALAFDAVEGHHRVSPQTIVPAEPRQGHVHEVLQAGSIVLPIVCLASILEAIWRQAQGGPRKES